MATATIGSGGDYATFAAWKSANTTANVLLGSAWDLRYISNVTEDIALNGIRSTDANYLRIYVADADNHQGQKSQGIALTGNISFASVYYGSTITIEGLRINATGKGTGVSGAPLSTASGGKIKLLKLFVYGQDDQGLIITADADDAVYYQNCIVEAGAGSNQEPAISGAGSTSGGIRVAYCTVAKVNGSVQRGYHNCHVINSLAAGDGSHGNLFNSLTNSGDTDRRNASAGDSTGNYTFATTDFVDYANGDYRLATETITNVSRNSKSTSTLMGSDITVDAKGDTRPSPSDLGALHKLGAGGGGNSRNLLLLGCG